MVEEPMSPEKVEDIKDTGVIERLNPTLNHWSPTARQGQTSRLGRGRYEQC